MTGVVIKSRYRVVMLALSFSIAFLLHLLLFGTAPMVTAIMAELSLSHADFGFIYSAIVISLVLFRLPWGIVGDRVGYLNAFRIALPISAVFATVRAFALGYPTFLVSQFFLGVGLAVVLPCLPLIVKEWVPEHPGLATGVYISGFAAGNATALGLTPYLLELLSWRHVLLTYSGFAALVCLLWWTIARGPGRSTSEMRLRSFALILKDKYVWALLLFMMAATGSYDTLTTWLPKVLEFKAVNPSYASLLSLGFFLAGPLIGMSLDRFKNTKMMVTFVGILAAVSIIGINYAPFSLLLLSIFVSGFATIGVLTISLTIPAEHPRLSAVAAGVVGLISSLGNVASLLLPVLFGFLIDVTGTYQASIWAVGAAVAIMIILGSRMSE